MNALSRVGMMAVVCCGVLASSGAAGEIPLLVTVDDLPLAQGSLYPSAEERAEISEGLIEALQAHGIQTVGFVTWRNLRVDGDRELLERWLAAGNELGNHSYSHRSLTRTDVEAYIDDLEAARKELAALLAGQRGSVRFFRYPLLHEGDTEGKYRRVRAYLEASGQRPVPVTLDNSDYAYNQQWVEASKAGDAEAVARIAQSYHEGLHLAVRSQVQLSRELFGHDVPQILLLHANAIGAAEWPSLFSWLRAEGFRFAGADEVLADEVFDQEAPWVGRVGPGLWQRMDSLRRRAEAERGVAELLQTQAGAWNRGDLEAFTSVYAGDALFVSPKDTTRGRAEVLARYLESYPDRAAMGSLSLEVVEIRLIDGIETTPGGESVPSRVHGATVVARWRLSYGEEAEMRSGLTMLTVRPTREGWEITQDASF